ncbi:MAG: 4-hydroxythreonine-4-phosphate dehydrogenase PdxA [Planctomycetes bacterium]|nr:4-hydroxythreonine-4-phosphate dehydrogenase PdxA [Planctomycetota bacterium]
MNRRPRLALTLGDPAGIGPEIALAALRDPRVRATLELELIGPDRLRPADVPLAPAGRREPFCWHATWAPASWSMGEVQADCGRSALAALRAGHELALTREVDALVTAPVSKEALHLAGERVEGQTELLGRWCGVTRYEMLAVAGELRVLLLTRHLPLRAAIDSITTVRVLDHLHLFHESLVRLGFARPRLALAGLNPHAGEHGVLGREDDELLLPAVEAACAAGLDVSGPLSPDTVFLQASRGRFDGVLALYHDQAFIPVKLLSDDGGVTVLAGLPYLRVSPVHGTAFDIAGRGVASAENLIQALLRAAAWVRERSDSA